MASASKRSATSGEPAIPNPDTGDNSQDPKAYSSYADQDESGGTATVQHSSGSGNGTADMRRANLETNHSHRRRPLTFLGGKHPLNTTRFASALQHAQSYQVPQAPASFQRPVSEIGTLNDRFRTRFDDPPPLGQRLMPLNRSSIHAAVPTFPRTAAHSTLKTGLDGLPLLFDLWEDHQHEADFDPVLGPHMRQSQPTPATQDHDVNDGANPSTGEEVHFRRRRSGQRLQSVNDIANYPSPIVDPPADLSCYEVCQQYPNSLQFEVLWPLIQRRWSAEEIFQSMRADVQTFIMGRDIKHKTMFISKRLEKAWDLLKKRSCDNGISNDFIKLLNATRMREDGRPAEVKRFQSQAAPDQKWRLRHDVGVDPTTKRYVYVMMPKNDQPDRSQQLQRLKPILSTAPAAHEEFDGPLPTLPVRRHSNSISRRSSTSATATPVATPEEDPNDETASYIDPSGLASKESDPASAPQSTSSRLQTSHMGPPPAGQTAHSPEPRPSAVRTALSANENAATTMGPEDSSASRLPRQRQNVGANQPRPSRQRKRPREPSSDDFINFPSKRHSAPINTVPSSGSLPASSQGWETDFEIQDMLGRALQGEAPVPSIENDDALRRLSSLSQYPEQGVGGLAVPHSPADSQPVPALSSPFDKNFLPPMAAYSPAQRRLSAITNGFNSHTGVSDPAEGAAQADDVRRRSVQPSTYGFSSDPPAPASPAAPADHPVHFWDEGNESSFNGFSSDLLGGEPDDDLFDGLG